MLDLCREETAELERAVRWVARGFGSTNEDAADLAQDTILKLLEQGQQAPESKAARAAWARKAARNGLIDRYRHNRRFQKVALDEARLDAGVEEKHDDELEFTCDESGERLCIDASDVSRVVAAALEGIAHAERREVAQLWFCDRLTIKEITAATGIGASTISSHVARVKKLLRRTLSTYAAALS